MRNVAPGWLVAASLVCAGLLAGAAAGQPVPEHPVKAAAWPPAYQAETNVAKLEQELHDAQAKMLALRTKATQLAKASRQAEAKEAALQADEAEQVARAIQARIMVVQASNAQLLQAPADAKVAVVAQGIEPPVPHEEKLAAPPAAGLPAAVAPPAALPQPAPTAAAPAPAAAPADPDAALAQDSAQIDALVQGSAAVSAPDKGTVGESFIAYLRVSPDKLATVLAQLKADHPEDAVQKGQGIRLTPRMTATASGEGLAVSPEQGQVQAVSSTETTEWQWQVTPTTSGVHTLTVTLTGSLNVQGQDTPRNFLAANQTIEVPVSIPNFFQQNWQWLVSTLALPAIGALWAVFRKRTQEGGAGRPAVRRGARARRTDGA
jgi:hypothetical protein